MTDRRREARVAVTYPLPGGAVQRLSARYETRVRRQAGAPTPGELHAFIGSAEAVITLLTDPVPAEVLEMCPHLRVIANCAVGYDNVDLEAARRLGVWVTNTPDVLTEATADLTWALILAVTRRVVEGDGLLRAGGFTGWRPDFFLGAGIQGRTLGIIGYGNIGRAVARRAAAFGMEVVYTDTEPVDGVAPEARFLPLEDLLRESHVLSVHCPLTPLTHHLLDRRRLGLLPSGAVVVNTARGPVVDESALAEALAEGRLSGAGLDVFEHEPRVHPALLKRSDVVLLPHLGSATVATRTAMADLAVANAEAVLEGREPPTPVVRGWRSA